MADMAAVYPPYVKEQLLRQEKGDEARRPGALQGSQYLSLATRHATSKWYHSRGPPPLARAELDTVGVIFRCFVAYLPLDRIEGPLPRTAWQDGQRLVQQHGVRFGKHLKLECEGRGPDRATLSDLQKGLWSYWFPKLSNSRLRQRLWPDQGDPQDGYEENEMGWRGFHITHRELKDAIEETVLRYCIARDIGLEVD